MTSSIGECVFKTLDDGEGGAFETSRILFEYDESRTKP